VRNAAAVRLLNASLSCKMPRRSQLVIAVAVFLLVGCSSGLQPNPGGPTRSGGPSSSPTSSSAAESSAVRSTTRQTLSLKLAQGTQTPISLTTFPGAICTVSNSTWTFRADANGAAEIFVTPTHSFSSLDDDIACVAGAQQDLIHLRYAPGRSSDAIVMGTKPQEQQAPNAATIAQYVAQYGFDPQLGQITK